MVPCAVPSTDFQNVICMGTTCVVSAAEPLAINDDGLTPLDMARAREHVTVVRIIEVHEGR